MTQGSNTVMNYSLFVCMYIVINYSLLIYCYKLLTIRKLLQGSMLISVLIRRCVLREQKGFGGKVTYFNVAIIVRQGD